ncbi:hypothetical protein ACONDI_00581 [Natranaerofaba carboxydovora]|nr:hypothetical protein ACONDI_00581 [Natranaerofaba carboxydovora]
MEVFFCLKEQLLLLTNTYIEPKEYEEIQSFLSRSSGYIDYKNDEIIKTYSITFPNDFLVAISILNGIHPLLEVCYMN